MRTNRVTYVAGDVRSLFISKSLERIGEHATDIT